MDREGTIGYIVKNWTRTTFSPFVVIFALVSVRILVKNVKVTVIDFDVHVSTDPVTCLYTNKINGNVNCEL